MKYLKSEITTFQKYHCYSYSIPENEEEEQEDTECNKQSVGKWYTGKVFYSVKDMPTQGSSAIRGVAEVNTALMSHYDSENFPSRLYLYTDGGGDRKNTYRNPVERCHCIANLGMQSVGIMRSKQSPEFERAMAKCDGNADIRKECESNDTFKMISSNL